MTEKFIIFRHGETDWNMERRCMGKTDIPLNDAGRMQAKKLAGRLASEHIDVFYSSPLSRALETTQIIAESHGREIYILPELAEMNLGQFEGKTKKERIVLFPEFEVTNDTHREQMGMDTFGVAIPMQQALIHMLAESHPNKTFALGTHDQTMRALLVALGLPSNIKGEKLKNCAVTIIECDKNERSIIFHNDNSHLEAKA